MKRVPAVVASWTALNALMLVALSAAGFSLGRHHIVWASTGDYIASAIAIVVGTAAGASAAIRAPRNPVGWLILGLFTVLCGDGVLSFVPAWAVAVDQESGWWWGALASLEPSVWILEFSCVALALLLCPDGRPAGPRSAKLLRVCLVIWPLAYVMRVFVPAPGPNPPVDLVPGRLQAPAGAEPYTVPFVIATMILFVSCLVSLVHRYRRADRITRQQLTWVVLGSMSIPVTFLSIIVGRLVGGSWVVATEVWGLDLVLLGVPLALLLAMTRYRLYAVDAVRDSTVAWAATSIVLVAAFTSVVLTFGLVAGSTSAHAPALVALLTAAVVLAARPVHSRMQRAVNRRFHRRQSAAVAVVEQYVDGLRLGSAELSDLEAVLQQALGDPTLTVSVPSPEGWHRPDGSPAATLPAFEVKRGDTVVARLHASVDLAEEPGLLEGVGRAAMLALDNARLNLESLSRLAEVTQSRQRIVSAGYAERRRIERDLHDGAQQRLVAASLTLQRTVGQVSDPAALEAIRSTKDHLDHALRDLRDLAQGVHPAVLTEEGFSAAVETVADRFPVAVHVDLTDTRGVPVDIATAAYFVVCEAMTNAVKHAPGSSLQVCGGVKDGHLTVRVEDQGGGGAVVLPGRGLAGLLDRVEALHGRLSVTSGLTGTIVEVALPCESS